jgi:hypothetical protein
MRNSTKKIIVLPLLLLAGICLFTLTSSKPPVEKPECGERECCKQRNAEPTCDIKASGTEFGVFDAASRLFTAKS